MKFRKLYWVTEHIDTEGQSRVTGVYTSIPDLIRHGLNWQTPGGGSLRLTLTKLDSEKEPLGSWCSPSFNGLEERLQEFVETDEFSSEQCQRLVDELHRKDRAGVRA
jgi:hypothetical protein